MIIMMMFVIIVIAIAAIIALVILFLYYFCCCFVIFQLLLWLTMLLSLTQLQFIHSCMKLFIFVIAILLICYFHIHSKVQQLFFIPIHWNEQLFYTFIHSMHCIIILSLNSHKLIP